MVLIVNDTATTEIYPLSLHDALPICGRTAKEILLEAGRGAKAVVAIGACAHWGSVQAAKPNPTGADRKSTRLNSSHPSISYAVFCLKKKRNIASQDQDRR